MYIIRIGPIIEPCGIRTMLAICLTHCCYVTHIDAFRLYYESSLTLTLIESRLTLTESRSMLNE